jgi:hypothetical protein
MNRIRQSEVVVFVCCALLGSTASALAEVPAQFIAKQFTEALGRVPNQAEWHAWVQYYETNGCSLATLRMAKAFYLSREYLQGIDEPVLPVPGAQYFPVPTVPLAQAEINGFPAPPHRGFEHANGSHLTLDNAAKVLTLYRGLLNREPDADGYRGWLDDLNNGGSWTDVVDAYLNSGEFAGSAELICTGKPYHF